MLGLLRKKKLLVISDFITAIDRQVIARKGEEITPDCLRRIGELQPEGAAVFESFHETYHNMNVSLLLKEAKYAFLQQGARTAKGLEVLGSVSINDLVTEELTWLERQRYHYDHTLATAVLVAMLAADLFDDANRVREAASCALTHDFGINRMPDGLLSKEGSLSATETSILHEHPIYSHILLTYYQMGDPRPNALVALEHHENLLGTGYPKGVRPDSPYSMLIQIADTFDALISSRPYRPARTLHEALVLMKVKTHEGQFDADMFDLLDRCVAPHC